LSDIQQTQRNQKRIFKNIDFILTKDEFEISQKPYKIPVSIFLLGLT